MNELCALLEGAGLDPYLGFLHQVDYGLLVAGAGSRWNIRAARRTGWC